MQNYNIVEEITFSEPSSSISPFQDSDLMIPFIEDPSLNPFKIFQSKEINFTPMNCFSFSESLLVNENKEEEVEELMKNIYYISPKTTSKTTWNSENKENLKLNSEKKDENIIKSNENLLSLSLNKKRERNESEEKNEPLNEISPGDKDKIHKKIQNKFFTFLINLSNDFVKSAISSKIKTSFKQIDYELKKVTDFKNFENIKKWKLSDILKLRISTKYSKYDDDYNEKVLKRFINMSELFKKFVELNFMEIFKNYFYCNGENIKEIVFEGKIIKLSNRTKNFYMLMKDNESTKDVFVNIIKNIYLYDNSQENKKYFLVKK